MRGFFALKAVLVLADIVLAHILQTFAKRGWHEWTPSSAWVVHRVLSSESSFVFRHDPPCITQTCANRAMANLCSSLFALPLCRSFLTQKPTSTHQQVAANLEKYLNVERFRFDAKQITRSLAQMIIDRLLISNVHVNQ